MTGTTVLQTLLGAALVTIGVLAAALADRIRGLRITRDRAQPTAPRASVTPLRVVEPEPEGLSRAAADRVQRHLRTTADRVSMSKDVIAALVATGYRRADAENAVGACVLSEKDTIEDWTRAALRRAARGAAS